MAKPQYSGIWPQLRLIILARDGYRCQIGLPGCTKIATECDHVDPFAVHGVTGRYRAACKHCNSSLGAQVRNNRNRPTPNPSREW